MALCRQVAERLTQGLMAFVFSSIFLDLVDLVPSGNPGQGRAGECRGELRRATKGITTSDRIIVVSVQCSTSVQCIVYSVVFR